MLAELNGLLFSVSVIISSASRAGLQKVNHKYIILYVPKNRHHICCNRKCRIYVLYIAVVTDIFDVKH